jgi:hypothetical protein
MRGRGYLLGHNIRVLVTSVPAPHDVRHAMASANERERALERVSVRAVDVTATNWSFKRKKQYKNGQATHAPAAPGKLQQFCALPFNFHTALRFQSFNHSRIRVLVRRHLSWFLPGEYNRQRQRGHQRARAHFAALEVGVAVLEADGVAAEECERVGGVADKDVTSHARVKVAVRGGGHHS